MITTRPRSPLVALLAALSLMATVVYVAGATAPASASACPAVDPITLAVTPAPSPGVNWSGCDLSYADLTSANLANATLNSANLTEATFTGANLNHASLSGAQLTGVISGFIVGDPAALPTNWELLSGYLVGPGADLRFAALAGVDLTSSHLGGANLSHADLSNATLIGTDLRYADLTYTNVGGVLTNGTDMRDTNMYGAVLQGAWLSGADLRSVASGGITGTPSALPTSWRLANGFLVGPTARLFGANLSELDLSGVDLTSAGLLSANLTNSNLTNATFTGADVDQAKFAGAILTGVVSGGVTGTPVSLPQDWYLVDGAFVHSGPPGAPTGVSATAGNGQATVSWTAPVDDGGQSLTGYRITPYIGATAQLTYDYGSTETSQTVTGLTNGTTYTFKVAAKNAVGTGPQSLSTLPVTPTAPLAVGFLRVVTSPAEPSQITVDGTIADTWGLTWVKQSPGSHTVCFSAVTGYTTPACQTVTVDVGQTTVVTGSFTARASLRVVTSPAVDSRIIVDGIGRNNWGMWTDIAVGSHEVCFGAVAGYTPPPCQTVNLTAGANPTVTGTFTPSEAAGLTGVGLLRVTSSPAVPTQITVDGNIADTWGLTWLQVAPGSHEVCFGHVEGWSEPGCSTVTVAADKTAVVTGTFAQRGFLKINTNPAVAGTITIGGVPVNDWGNYTDRAPGTYHVCFGDVPGKTTPACQDPVVTAGNLTTITGTYT